METKEIELTHKIRVLQTMVDIISEKYEINSDEISHYFKKANKIVIINNRELIK